jgi:cytochrome c-type biogenesis protein CcmH/NrfG
MPNLRPIEFLLIAAVIFIIVATVYLLVRAAVSAGGKTSSEPRVTTPAEPLEARLAELADLRSRGVISEDEYQSARSSALHQG